MLSESKIATSSKTGTSAAQAVGKEALQRKPVSVVQKAESNNEKPNVTTYPVQLKGQDEVQKYLAGIAPDTGPIREYIDEHAQDNGGLCAGWVVLHRKNPDRLISMWKLVSEKIENEDEKGLGRETDKAVEMYMEAQYHFTKDPDNEEFVGPDEDVLSEAGISDEPTDHSAKVGGKSEVIVQSGHIVEMARAVHDGYSGSKKQLFVEIYSKSHTAQIEFRIGKMYSICESENEGIRYLNDAIAAEKIFTLAFFQTKKPDDTSMKLSFDLYRPS